MKKTFLPGLCMLLLFACSKEEEPEYEISDSYFKFNYGKLQSPSRETEFKVKISSNEDWELVSHPEWTTITPTQGNGNEEVIVTLSLNDTGVFREGEITFAAFYRTFPLPVNQQKLPLELVSYTGLESAVNMNEPRFLEFNAPVKLNFIISADETSSFFIGHDDVEYTDDGRVIKFKDGPAVLGTTQAYKFGVTDVDGYRLEKTIEVDFFTQIINTPGSIKNVILDEENNLWVSSLTYNPEHESSRIIKYVQNEDGYEEQLRFTIDLEPSPTFLSGNFFLNLHNDLFYIPDWEGEQVLVYTKTGSLVKKIGLTPNDAGDAKTRTALIGFNDQGKGILTLTTENSPVDPQATWNYIDSSKDDLRTEPSSFDRHFQRLANNHDGSKLFLFQEDSRYINILGATEDLDEINLSDIYGQGTVVSRIFQNRLDSRMLVSGKNLHQVFTPSLSYKGPQFTSSISGADFSYDLDYTNHLYTIRTNMNNGYLELLDYETWEPVYSHSIANYGVNELIATTDDKFIITYNEAGKITIISKEMLE